MNYQKIILFLISVFSISAFAAPVGLNFQARIKKPDGTNLESSDVSFRFKYLNAGGTCTVYIEDFNNISMVGSTGNVNFTLGTGAKVFPPSATDLSSTFSNNLTNTMSCSEGGTYAPLLSSEIRKVKVEFVYTGSGGLQTLNGIEVNSVPYAMYASDAETLAGSPAALFAKFSDFTTCTGGDVLTYNGTAFSCVTPAGGVGGSGTANRISKFTAGGVIGDSNISDDGTLVSTITDAEFNGVKVGRGLGNVVTNVVIGAGFTFNSNTTGNANVAVGYGVMTANTTGSSNVGIGTYSVTNNTTGNNNLAFGEQALYTNTTGNDNIAIGKRSLVNNGVGNFSVAVGTRALHAATGNNNIGLGYESGSAISSGSGNVILGSNTGSSIATTDNNIIISDGSGNIRQQIDSTGLVGMGMAPSTYKLSVNGDINIPSGSNFKINGVNIAAGTVGGTGTINNIAKFSATGTIANSNITDDGTLVTVSTDATINGVKIGLGAGSISTNLVVGPVGALSSNTTGYGNVAVGAAALAVNTTGLLNTALGGGALNANTTGNYNLALGTGAMVLNSTGNQNVVVGVNTVPNMTSGNNNLILGSYVAPDLLTGSQNTFIGTNVNPPSDVSNTVIIGDGGGGIRLYSDAAGNTGIGTLAATPQAKLDVAGTIRSSSFFLAAGGSQTAPGFTFHSPEVAADTGMFNPADGVLAFTTDGIEKVRINGAGNLGVGTNNPTSKLTINGGTASEPALKINSTYSQSWNNQPADVAVASTNTIGSGITLQPSASGTFASGWTIYAGAAASVIGDGSFGIWNATTANAKFVINQAGFVGIGPLLPDAKLHITGSSGTTLKIVDGNQAAGRVLASDSTGQASWVDPVNPRYSFISKSADFTVGTGEHGNIFLVTNLTNVTFPTAAAAGAGFHVMIKRMGASNVSLVTLPLDCPGGLTLSGNQSYVEMTSTGTDWILTNRSTSGTMCL